MWVSERFGSTCTGVGGARGGKRGGGGNLARQRQCVFAMRMGSQLARPCMGRDAVLEGVLPRSPL